MTVVETRGHVNFRATCLLSPYLILPPLLASEGGPEAILLEVV